MLSLKLYCICEHNNNNNNSKKTGKNRQIMSEQEKNNMLFRNAIKSKTTERNQCFTCAKNTKQFSQFCFFFC